MKQNSSNTLLFTESIAKGILMYEFNWFTKNDKATMFNFQGASSHQILHYLDVHLEDRWINIVVICIGINNILGDSSQSCIDGLWQNIKECLWNVKNLVWKYLYFGIGAYNQDKHCYFGKKSHDQDLPEIWLVLCQ